MDGGAALSLSERSRMRSERAAGRALGARLLVITGPIAAVLLALAAGAVLIAASGEDPIAI